MILYDKRAGMELSVEFSLVAKECIKIMCFNLKIRNQSSSINNVGATGIFLPVAKVFKIDQYVLALVAGLIFAPKLPWYSNFAPRIRFES